MFFPNRVFWLSKPLERLAELENAAIQSIGNGTIASSMIASLEGARPVVSTSTKSAVRVALPSATKKVRRGSRRRCTR
ncbi:hypothetical protein BOSE62_190035 [Bosea sp. 62]|nr:hypothetical protein BOSE46_70643 [Bosea sp. 46]VVT60761.1 hypothetical protein BOS5A_230038 [Bosea sp. EC-HK365B]VXC05271.1 hypothetical protein BOSE62_190035 [Bosea sp. 62]VXC66974.1 hypothetical protein BOSE29B_50612 [Bosea sp. 29B]